MKKQFSIQELAKATNGQVVSSHKEGFTGLGTDTRKDLNDQLFVALKGPSYDGHKFLDGAIAKGASVLLVHESDIPAEVTKKVSVVQVSDTLKGLQDFGRYVRRNSEATVIGITGSNGKTSTKEFAAQLIGQYQKVHYSKGSFNNHWGVPLTLVDIDDQDELVLCEMGMNHAGEIKELVGIAEPDVVLCMTVGQAHLEFFASMEELAQAKSEIYQYAKTSALGVFNLDNEHTHTMYQAWCEDRGAESAITFSVDPEKTPTVNFKIQSMEKDALILSGRIQRVQFHENQVVAKPEGQPNSPASQPITNSNVRVPVFGEQNVFNLMAASCLGLAAGLTPEQIWQALPQCSTTWGRNQAVKLRSGADVIFDGYNANPDSMKALLENVAKIEAPGPRYAVLGEMLEMGEQSGRLHEELGFLAARSGLDWLWFVGGHGHDFDRGLKRGGFSKKAVFSKAYDETIASRLRSMLEGREIILIKGSRGIKLEQVVQALDPIEFAAKA